ncbi:hypothetical protein O181_002957 [Austropuccinia psidii MF-1]|uniref:Integrase catalytic domain-containing protein n=1 Tax=Austropuccinia psidii MF-1 TaxID=1389203 RepID=A0A9Q3GEG1_9BASI|nr:hypothetical protein [Austropuccinia psidii MF-1]
MFNSKAFFLSISETTSITISTSDSSSTLKAFGVGTVQLLCDNKTLTLKNCLYVPHLNCNLISLIDLFRDQLIVNQKGSYFNLEAGGKTLLKGCIFNNLIHVDYSLPRGLLSINLTTLWHNRLGHPGSMPAKLLGLPSGLIGCMTCNLNKAHRLPFSNHFEHANLPLDCVHTDLEIGCLFSIPLNKKGHGEPSQQNTKKIVSDRGGEFLNANFNDLSTYCGFKHVFSPPETPQQNGFAERGNCTILEKACCILGASNLPRLYWADMVNTATMLSNILPTPSRLNKSPYTLWTGQSPRIQRLRTFGGRAIVAVLRNHWVWKLGETGCEGIFLGYENENTAYRVLRVSDSKILTTKHVIFCEIFFPYLKDKETTDSCSFVVEEPDSAIRAETHPAEEPTTETGPSQPLNENHGAPSDKEDAPCEEEGPIPDLESKASPATQSKIRVIGLHHPTLITSEINNLNILPYSRRENALVTCAGILPCTFNAAISSMDKDKWIKAIRKELSSMVSLDVWDVVEFSKDYKIVGTTWVFKIKRNHLNEIIYTLNYINFNKTYLPTGCLNYLWTLIAFSASESLHFHQVDVKSAFLNAPLVEDVYLSVPQGLEVDQQCYCLKLKKAIYGLKQAPLAWYERLKTWLVKIGFYPCASDPCVFHRADQSPTWLYVHVDDISIFGRDVTIFKEKIALEFDIKDIGPADLMLGIKINQFDDVITLDQQHFAESLVHLYGMADCKPTATPLIPNTHLQPATLEDISKLNPLKINFRSAIGGINYLSTATTPDLSFAVSSLSQFLEKPGFTHWQSFLHVLRYLKGPQHIGLSYAKDMAKGVVAYSDADWGNFLVTRRSVTGHLTVSHGCIVLWKTRKQCLVSLYMAEAEYKDLCDLTSELLWLRQWCREAKIFDFVGPITVFGDNQSCIKRKTGNSNLNHKRMKQVDI